MLRHIFLRYAGRICGHCGDEPPSSWNPLRRRGRRSLVSLTASNKVNMEKWSGANQRTERRIMDTFEQLSKDFPNTQCACGDPVSIHTAEAGHWCTRRDCGCTMFMTRGEMEEFLIYCFGPDGWQAMRLGLRDRYRERQRPH
jgi:hypothetical protein